MSQLVLPQSSASRNNSECNPTGTESLFLGTRWPVVLWRIWIALALALAIRIAIQPTKHTVTPIYLDAAHRWWNDQALYQKADLDYFRYPPLFAILFTPLSWMGTIAGSIAWSWLSLGIFLCGLYRFEREVLPGDRDQKSRALLFLFAILGAISGLWNGQANALLVGMLLLGGAALVRERWWLAAFWIAGTVTLKLTPVPILLLVCALWFRPMWWRSLIVLGVGFALPFLTRSPDVVLHQYQGWIHHLQSTSGARWPGFRDAWTIWIVLEHQFVHQQSGLPYLKQPLQSDFYRILQVITGGAVLVWCFSLKGMSNRWKVTCVMGMASAWLMLFGPATEHPTYVFLSPFLAWAIMDRNRYPRWNALIVTSAVLILVLGWRALTVDWWEFFPWFILALPLGTITFAGWFLAIQRRASSEKSSMHFS